jgi:hypothetical protein
MNITKACSGLHLSVIILMCFAIISGSYIVFVGPPVNPVVVAVFVVVWILGTSGLIFFMAAILWAVFTSEGNSP